MEVEKCGRVKLKVHFGVRQKLMGKHVSEESVRNNEVVATINGLIMSLRSGGTWWSMIPGKTSN